MMFRFRAPAAAATPTSDALAQPYNSDSSDSPHPLWDSPTESEATTDWETETSAPPAVLCARVIHCGRSPGQKAQDPTSEDAPPLAGVAGSRVPPPRPPWENEVRSDSDSEDERPCSACRWRGRGSFAKHWRRCHGRQEVPSERVLARRGAARCSGCRRVFDADKLLDHRMACSERPNTSQTGDAESRIPHFGIATFNPNGLSLYAPSW